MIVLSERLQEMANNILPGESMADIGTDHGYLPLYLYEKNVNNGSKSESELLNESKVESGDNGNAIEKHRPIYILTDVSKGSLDKAKENYIKYFCEGDTSKLQFNNPSVQKDLNANKTIDGHSHLSFRLGDGLEPLEYGEVDAVVMAGMGGLLMAEIMDWDTAKTLSFKKYILQPRNNGGALRRYLYEHNIAVEKLLIVPEDKRYCEIMVCTTPFKGKGTIGNVIDNSTDNSTDSSTGNATDDSIGNAIDDRVDTSNNVRSMFNEKAVDLRDSNHISDEEFDFPDVLKDNLKETSGKLAENTRNYLLNSMEIEQRIVDNIRAGRKANNEPETDPAIEFREKRIKRLKKLLDNN